MPARTPKPQPPHRRYETLAGGADRTGMSKKTIRRRIADGTLTAYRAGPRLIRLDSDELDRLMQPIPTAGGDAA